jgi:hypothetical protein
MGDKLGQSDSCNAFKYIPVVIWHECAQRYLYLSGETRCLCRLRRWYRVKKFMMVGDEEQGAETKTHFPRSMRLLLSRHLVGAGERVRRRRAQEPPAGSFKSE